MSKQFELENYLSQLLYSFPSTQIIQHSRWTTPPQETILDADDIEKGGRTFPSFLFGEYVSPSQTGEDLSVFFKLWRKCVRLVSGGTVQRDGTIKGGVDPKPLVIRSDCAPQCQQGPLSAYRKDKHVTTRLLYHNIVLYVLLYFEFASLLTDGIEGRIAAMLATYLLYFVPMFFHFCKSHVYRAIRDWIESNDRERDVKNIGQPIRSLFKHLALKMTDTTSLSEAFTYLCAMIVILRTKEFLVPPFNINSQVSLVLMCYCVIN